MYFWNGWHCEIWIRNKNKFHVAQKTSGFLVRSQVVEQFFSAASFGGRFGKAILWHLRPWSCHSRGGGQNLKVNLVEMMNIVNRSGNMLVFAKSRGVLIRACKYLIYMLYQESLLNRFVSELKAPETIVIRKRLRKSRRTSRKPQRRKTAKGRTDLHVVLENGNRWDATRIIKYEAFKSSWQFLEIFSLICIDAWHFCSIPYQTVLTGSWRGTCRIRHGSRGVPASAMDLIRFFSAPSKDSSDGQTVKHNMHCMDFLHRKRKPWWRWPRGSSECRQGAQSPQRAGRYPGAGESLSHLVETLCCGIGFAGWWVSCKWNILNDIECIVFHS